MESEAPFHSKLGSLDITRGPCELRRRHLNIRLALRSSNSRRPRRASFALLVVSMGGLGGGGATIIQAGSHSTFFVTLGLAFCQPICGPHLCHPEYKKHPFIYRSLVFFCSLILNSWFFGAL